MSLQESLAGKAHELKLSASLVPIWFWAVIGLIFFFFVVLPCAGITFGINSSPSIEKKVFMVIQGTFPSCGELGAFYFGIDHNPYWRKGTKFIKRFAGCPGDMLVVRNRKFYVNGNYVGTARSFDLKGNPVRNFTWDGRIPQDSYFVMGDSPLSYDSRYWGFVDKGWIVGKGYPVF